MWPSVKSGKETYTIATMMRRFKLRRKKKEEEKGKERTGREADATDRKAELEDPTSAPMAPAALAMASGDPTYKVILCGEYGVGKSSIFRRFLNDTYNPNHSPRSTLGLDQCTRPFTVDQTPVKLTMWDTGGMERMSFIGASYYRGANAALLVYNSNNKETFTILSQYILDIAMNAEGAKIFLCGNAAAESEAKDKVQEADMEAFMAEGGDMLSGVYSVSCEDNQGLEHMFQDIARVLHTDAMRRLTLPRDMIRTDNNVQLDTEPPGNKRCC